MFLITTAVQRFWKTDEPVLFLGEWCKLFSQRSVWEKISYEVLPYHWDDRKKLYQDYLYLDKLYEQILLQMKDLLNQMHGVKHSLRYWRIIVGPWLYYFIQILYDRYQSIVTAAECGKVTNTFICNYERGHQLSNDFAKLPKLFVSDDYNQYLYTRIIEYTNRLPFEVIKANPQNKSFLANDKKYSFILKTLMKKIILFYQKAIPDRFNKIVLISSSLKISDLIKLQLSLKQIPYPFPPDVVIPESRVDLAAREKLSLKSSGDEFEQLLFEMIKEQIPSNYVEGYAQMNEISLNAYPRLPKIIFTSIAFHINEAFKFWAAYHVDRGIKFVGIQHGGHYGTGLWSSQDNHEIRIYDRFYTWGWKSDLHENVKPFSSGKLNVIKENIRPKKSGRLLMVLTSMTRYSYVMYSAVVASGTLAYFNDQYRFVRSLSEKNRKLLLVRLDSREWGWSDKDRWFNEFPAIECYSGNKSMLDQLNESSLFIGTNNATSYLEAFAANFPTILFWNPNHWELRPSAEPYFDELRSAGILHDTPESAAAKTNEICHDPISWWQQPEIQEAKNRFCYQFARTSDNWLEEWKAELLSLSSTPK